MTQAGADATLDRDVVVVGGGPAGATAGVFTARYGLDTLVCDRGNAALPRCAYLENYPGFPGGIDVAVFADLLQAHLETAGATRIADLVEAVRHREAGGFRVETADGRTVTTRSVIAAAWYDGSYLRPLGVAEMFSEQEHHGEVEQRFDPDYPDADGRTPIEGLYVASPAGERSAQAVVAAGNGAHVARSLIADRRRDTGYPGDLARHYDWLRSESEFAGAWAERDRWREWFEGELPADHDLSEARMRELRERYIDDAFDTLVADSTAEDRARDGLATLVDTIGPERVLAAIDDETIREYVTRAEDPPDD